MPLAQSEVRPRDPSLWVLHRVLPVDTEFSLQGPIANPNPPTGSALRASVPESCSPTALGCHAGCADPMAGTAAAATAVRCRGRQGPRRGETAAGPGPLPAATGAGAVTGRACRCVSFGCPAPGMARGPPGWRPPVCWYPPAPRCLPAGRPARRRPRRGRSRRARVSHGGGSHPWRRGRCAGRWLPLS